MGENLNSGKVTKSRLNMSQQFNLQFKVIEFKWLIGPFPFPKFKFDLIASLTYLIPSSQDFFSVFPQAKKFEIADDKVQPVPCVLLVAILLLFIMNIVLFDPF